MKPSPPETSQAPNLTEFAKEHGCQLATLKILPDGTQVALGEMLNEKGGQIEENDQEAITRAQLANLFLGALPNTDTMQDMDLKNKRLFFVEKNGNPELFAGNNASNISEQELQNIYDNAQGIEEIKTLSDNLKNK